IRVHNFPRLSPAPRCPDLRCVRAIPFQFFPFLDFRMTTRVAPRGLIPPETPFLKSQATICWRKSIVAAYGRRRKNLHGSYGYETESSASDGPPVHPGWPDRGWHTGIALATVA